MRILIPVIALLFAAQLSASELRYNTVVRIATGGEDIDFSAYRYVRPILQLRYRGQRQLPADARVEIEASSGAVTLRPDPLGAIEWPMQLELQTQNPLVTSAPDGLVAAGRVRVAMPPARLLPAATIRAMAEEYDRFKNGLAFLKRMAAPSPRGVLIVAPGPIEARSASGIWRSEDGILRVPMDTASAADITLSASPKLVALDLGLE